MNSERTRSIILAYSTGSGEVIERTLTGKKVGYKLNEDDLKGFANIWADQETFIVPVSVLVYIHQPS